MNSQVIKLIEEVAWAILKADPEFKKSADGLEQEIPELTGMFEPIERGPDLLWEIVITRCKLIAEEVVSSLTVCLIPHPLACSH